MIIKVYLTKKVKVKSLSHVRLFATPWTVAYQAPLSIGFSRQQYWSGLPFPSPRDLPNPRIESGSPTSQTDTLPSEPPGKSDRFTLFFLKVSRHSIAWIYYNKCSYLFNTIIFFAYVCEYFCRDTFIEMELLAQSVCIFKI